MFSFDWNFSERRPSLSPSDSRPVLLRKPVHTPRSCVCLTQGEKYKKKNHTKKNTFLFFLSLKFKIQNNNQSCTHPRSFQIHIRPSLTLSSAPSCPWKTWRSFSVLLRQTFNESPSLATTFLASVALLHSRTIFALASRIGSQNSPVMSVRWTISRTIRTRTPVKCALNGLRRTHWGTAVWLTTSTATKWMWCAFNTSTVSTEATVGRWSCLSFERFESQWWRRCTPFC